jgi:hypothetical protein
MMKSSLFLALFLSVAFFSKGQNISRLGMEANYGFIIPHSTDLRSISQFNPYGFTVHYQNLNLKAERWNACNCFHYLGVQFSYHNFANQDVLGAAYSISGTFEPILWKSKKSTLSLLTGVGVSYLNKVYNETSNPENLFFSTPISFLLFLTPKFEYRFSDAWTSHISFAYNHISNGGQKQPNKGMNYPMLGLGINKYFNTVPFPTYNKNALPKDWNWYLESGVTTNESQWSEGRQPMLSILGGVYKSISSINALGGGLDIVLDYSHEVEHSRSEAFMPAPFIANHFLFGRFDFNQKMALYTHKPNGYNDHIFYQRYTITYRIVEGFSMGFSLKTHGHVAENMDFRFSYVF